MPGRGKSATSRITARTASGRRLSSCVTQSLIPLSGVPPGVVHRFIYRGVRGLALVESRFDLLPGLRANDRTGGRDPSGAANGPRTATGLPRLVITNRSPASTTASSLEESCRNSLTVANFTMGNGDSIYVIARRQPIALTLRADACGIAPRNVVECQRVARASIIDRITVRDYRCFRDKQTARLAPLTLLVGENSTGKTSFLALIRAFWDVAVRETSRISRSTRTISAPFERFRTIAAQTAAPPIRSRLVIRMNQESSFILILIRTTSYLSTLRSPSAEEHYSR